MRNFKEGEKYLLVKANYWPKGFEDVHHLGMILQKSYPSGRSGQVLR